MSIMLPSFFIPSNKASPNIVDNNKVQEKVKFENVHIKKFKDSSLEKYVSKYNFYKMSFDRNNYISSIFITLYSKHTYDSLYGNLICRG